MGDDITSSSPFRAHPKYLTANPALAGQELRIQPRTRNRNLPSCSGEVIQEPLQSVSVSLRTNGEAVGTGVLCG